MSETNGILVSLLEEMKRLENENAQLRKMIELSNHEERTIPLSQIQTPLNNLRLEHQLSNPKEKSVNRCVDSILAYAKAIHFG